MTTDESEAIVDAETTVQWVCETYPDRIATLFGQIDLGCDGLQTVKAAVESNNHVAACEALLEYYRTGTSGTWLRWGELPKPNGERDPVADAILNDTFTFYTQTDRTPRRPDGGLDWKHRGPTGDWEWTLALNRHHHILNLLGAYRKTGNRSYAQRIDTHLRDWVRFSLPYPAQKNVGELWRGLEVSFRAKAWAAVFYALQKDDTLTPAARLLLLTSLPEHAHHLRHFHSGHNWLTMELSALAMIAAAWPEFKDSPSWFDYASSTMTQELSNQIYPDGVQNELTSHYHRFALGNFEQFATICRGAGIPISDEYATSLESMWNYMAAVIRPDGHGPLNNDSDLDYNRDIVLTAAKTYSRPDWAYIASNGIDGEKPRYGPSVFFPWAGQLVVRSGWDADALWAFFDIGPWGTAHQHNDKLHLSVSAHGRDLLVDSGRFVYSGNNARFRHDYALKSHAHNVVNIDGKGQKPGPPRAEQPIGHDDFHVARDMAFARGSCDHFDAPGTVVHTRVVVHLDTHLLLVADRVVTDRARTLEAFWHWHPRCTVKVDDGSIVSTDADQGNLRVTPLSPFTWDTAIVRGQETPSLQGWYSRCYNVWEPCPTAVLSTRVAGTSTFAWLLHTARGQVSRVSGEILESNDDSTAIRVVQPAANEIVVRIPWNRGHPSIEKQSD